MEKIKVGFIGLGTMGRPMALNVLKGGYPVVAFDVNPAAVDALVEAGAGRADSPAAVAAASDVVITMLPDAPDVERVALGPGGIAEGIHRGAIHIDMSTIDPGTTRRVGAALAERGVRMVDSPVGKTQDHAIAGTLTLMVGGDPADVEEVRPVLMCMGDTLFHCGPLGTGEAMKLANNYLAECILAATAEAVVMGAKAGLTLELMQRVIATTMAGNNQLAVALPKKAFAGDFKPGFMIRLGHKDHRLALEMADQLGVTAPVGRATMSVLDDARRRGFDGDDVTSLLRVREEDAGVTVRLAPGPKAA